jgi:hypothetical protein
MMVGRHKAEALALLTAVAALASLSALSSPSLSLPSTVVLSPVTDRQTMPEYEGAKLYKGVPLLDLSAPQALAGSGKGGGDRSAGAEPASGATPWQPCTIGVYCPPAGWASIWHRLVSRMQKEMSTDTMEIANLKNQV